MNATTADETRVEEPVTVTDSLLQELREASVLETLTHDQLSCLQPLQIVHTGAGTTLVRKGEDPQFFWILMEGEVDVYDILPNGHEDTVYTYGRGSSFGELPLLANIPNAATLRTRTSSRLLRMDETAFWRLMTTCPDIRRSILRNMAYRLQKMQSRAVQQEKMAALGTLAAGLMHELNNPGTAARRAASQLRENLNRLHELSARFSRTPMSGSQKECLLDLQDLVLQGKSQHHLSSIEQSDAEEALSEWMESAHIGDAWRLAPTLASVGLSSEHLACARREFDAAVLTDAHTWVEALVSSQQLVTTIEESIGRVADLVKAVKSYAYEGKGQVQSVDINESLHATLIILGHKLREKQAQIHKNLAANLPALQSNCSGINQVWTNLLDNAIDAIKPGGTIGIRTWSEQKPGGPMQLCVEIRDDGEGIPPEIQSHIFDPFFTTKSVGVGTGLGLGIVQRLVEQFHGAIHFSSEPGATEFIVRIPASRPT